MKQFVFLAGLPRSGSSLLSALLSQNPQVYAEGNSALCQLMWDNCVSMENACSQQLMANRRYTTQFEVVGALPHLYYANTDKPIVVDKCRSWTMPANLKLITSFITPNPRVIVLTRDIDEIVESFRGLYERNGLPFDADLLMREGSEPLMRSLDGVNHARSLNNDWFLFMDYNDLVADTLGQLERIYDFICEPMFSHDLNNIVVDSPEDDSVYGLNGMHDVRPSIGLRRKEVV